MKTNENKAGAPTMRILFAGAVAALLLIVSLASAAELSRSEYTAAVEPICKTNSKASERILKPVMRLVKKGKLRPAATRFFKASRALKRTYVKLRVVPQPTADEARLAKWLGYVKVEANLFAKVGRKLKAGQKGPAQRFVNRLTTNANRANSTVLLFGFHFCRFEPSKFT
jgi:hypothetical protein